MKKHCFNIIMLVLCALFLIGCAREKVSDTTEDEENSMPSIVFTYTHSAEEEIYMLIDKYGDIYLGEGEAFCYSTAEEKMESYETYINVTNSEKIGSIDVEELQKKYHLLKEIEKDGNYEWIQEESVCDVYLGQHIWKGYCYNKKGELISIGLHGEGDCTCTNEDTRAEELAEWMKEIQIECGLRIKFQAHTEPGKERNVYEKTLF